MGRVRGQEDRCPESREHAEAAEGGARGGGGGHLTLLDMDDT